MAMNPFAITIASETASRRKKNSKSKLSNPIYQNNENNFKNIFSIELRKTWNRVSMKHFHGLKLWEKINVIF